jgi:hypothetical protein
MLKHTPSENRAMFVAAGTALAGMIGGITAILAGLALRQLEGWTLTYAGYTAVGFHVLFVISLALRLAGVHLARALHEPGATRTREVVWQLALAPLARRLGIAFSPQVEEVLVETSPVAIPLLANAEAGPDVKDYPRQAA